MTWLTHARNVSILSALVLAVAIASAASVDVIHVKWNDIRR